MGVGDGNPRAARLYVRLGYRHTGVLDVCEYDWTDDDGQIRHGVEHNECLIKDISSDDHSPSPMGSFEVPRNARPAAM